MIALERLGPRIAIIGPSNAGKSTLAALWARRLGRPVTHLDQLAHKPGTHWQRRSDEDFIALHDQAIAQECWVIEGNYRVTMPQRLARATAIVWLDPPLAGCVWRYAVRSLFGRNDRVGNLQGAQSQFSFDLVRYILKAYPAHKAVYREVIAQNPHLVRQTITSFGEIKKLCRAAVYAARD